jgi:hypothetical protein
MDLVTRSFNMNADLRYLLEVFVGIFLSAVCYMIFPIIIMTINLLKTGKKLKKETARKISLWNSIGIGAFFFLISVLNGSQWRPLPAIIYYYINTLVMDIPKD